MQKSFKLSRRLILSLITSFLLTIGQIVFVQAQSDSLPSWNSGQTKQSIIQFVDTVTDRANPNYIPPEQRIAVFDNDGTLWTERPFYVQLFFVIDRVKELSAQHPEWKTEQPFKAILENDKAQLSKLTEADLVKLVMVTHAGMTTEEFSVIVKNWLATAKHPRFNRLFTELVYQPMLEVLSYLRANNFKTYIVSGGGVEFIRAFAEKVYGIPPEQVIGSRIKTKYELRDGQSVLISLPEVDFIDDGEGKPVGINHHIGRRPVAAFGNSDGDLQMLQWTAAGQGKTLKLLVHHTDAEREYQYDRQFAVGRLDKALDEAQQQGWTVVDMKRDWKRIYPFN